MSHLRALILEDNPDDAELLLAELEAGGLDVDHRREQSEEGLERALAEADWDIVLSDYSMPSFSALDALAFLKQSGRDIPVIVVSGTIGEDTAVAAFHAGARDFLVKGKLRRLLPAIERELREKEARLAKRRAEQALLVSEMRFRRLAESGMVGITVAASDGRLLEANDAFLDIIGIARAEFEACGLSAADLHPQNWHAAAVTEELQTRGVSAPFEARLLRRSGGYADVVVVVAELSEDRYIALLLDHSHHKRLEEQLRQSQKMEAIGSLAGGVAHDFNNLLSVILSYSDLILADLKEDDPLRPDIDQIKRAGERAADLTRQLLAFGRQQILEPRPLDLAKAVLGLEPMLRRIIGEDVTLSIRGKAIARVCADPTQMDQVVMNLVVNARDAMPNGGQIEIEIRSVELDSANPTDHVGLAPGHFVVLAVRDTGVGMDAATKAKVFEPFFTTKEKGRGTGLGLSTVFGIVKQSGGHIQLSSEPGRGTTFTVYLPAYEGDDRDLPRKDTGRPASLDGTETILLVEDEDEVRAIIRNILRRRGYSVLEAQNGDEALQLGRDYPTSIQLLLTDVVMPGMSGRELAERMKPLRPEMRLLYLSGYTENTVGHHGVLDAAVAFMQKPVIPDALVRKVREVLDG